MRARVHRRRDKQRQCIASAVRRIFPPAAPFSCPHLYPATAASRKIRRRKTDTSRSKVRILFPETLLPRIFSSRFPAWAVLSSSSLFLFLLSPSFLSPSPAVSLIPPFFIRAIREETESRVKTVRCRRANPGVDSLRLSVASRAHRNVCQPGRARFQNGETIFFSLGGVKVT